MDIRKIVKSIILLLIISFSYQCKTTIKSDNAFELGFSSPSDFSRVFKKQFGCTPRQVQQGSYSH